MYTRFHVQERFSWLSFVICILKCTFRYLNTNISLLFTGISCIWIHSIFLIWLVPGTTWKGLFYSFKFGAFWYLLITSIFGFCPGNMSWLFAVEICRSFLPWELPAAICRENLPWLFAVGICRSYLPWLFFFFSLHYFTSIQISYL